MTILHTCFSYEGLQHNIEESDAFNAETSDVESGAIFSFSCSNATTVLKKEFKSFAIECFNGNWYNISKEPPDDACVVPQPCEIKDFKESRSYMEIINEPDIIDHGSR